MGSLVKIRQWSARLKAGIAVLYYANRDPRTPLVAKLLCWLVVAYALSPIDLIPDFIPIIGHLDDLIIVPAGIWLAYRLIPGEVLIDAQIRARQGMQKALRTVWLIVALIVVVWVALIVWILSLIF